MTLRYSPLLDRHLNWDHDDSAQFESTILNEGNSKHTTSSKHVFRKPKPKAVPKPPEKVSYTDILTGISAQDIADVMERHPSATKLALSAASKIKKAM